MSGTLFDLPPNVRLSDPVTSREAADVDRSIIRERVRAALLAHPEGLTDWQLVDALGADRTDKGSITKRRQECGAVPVLVDGEPLYRPSPKGKRCTVWRLA